MEKILRDPVHDLIPFSLEEPTDRLLLALMDTPEFQRLRRIRQTGFAFLVFPGAEHSRLTHSLGVLHLCRRMLQRLDPHQRVDALLRTACQCAALLHDLGHGPYSHVMEAWFGFRHEVWTARVLLDPSTRVHELLAAHDPQLPSLTVDAMEGRLEPRWLSQLLNSQLDVDRLDYLLRDSHMTGVKDGIFDLERLLLMLRIDPAEGGLFLDSKGLLAAEKYIQSRYQMYRQVYFHKTVAGAEALLLSILRRVSDLLLAGDSSVLHHCPPPLLPYFLHPTTLTVTQYLAVDDALLTAALEQWASPRTTTDPLLHDLAGRLLHRELFKCIEVQNFDSHDLEHGLRIERARALLFQHGFDPAYYLLTSSSSDTPYKPYTASPAQQNAILIQSSPWDSTLSDLQHVSAIVRALTQSPYSLWRVFYPDAPEVPGWRAKMREVFTG